ncbi:polyprenyl synthetase family protein [Leptospira sp. GIMC2001]|uniref:polyprenyl synthetase family protein n=1 Tax=Leptospira sp. GIMC2001 TaxID=1513297 RepID=UPI00234B233E|nr:polyprenyl synthetase family protein [Leptospira sp. GIMC2001]WCL49859.1 polyprenyl synthetase family protein [Leptospira sp. GIMC2001]
MNISLAIKKVDSTLDSLIREDLKILRDVKKHVIESGGKRIRPLTHLLLCDILEYTGKEQWIVASITELIHAASLLHDDVVDQADTRRGKKTVGALHGNKTAILAGDFLLACGIERLNKLRNPLLMDSFTEVIRDLAVSELLQMQWEKNPKITLQTYEQIIYGKTASLFGAATECVGILKGWDRKKSKSLREFGITMGRIFQKRDDLLDYFTDSKTSGKVFLKDFHNKLYTYPIIFLRDKALRKDRELIVQSINASNEKKILELLEGYEVEKLIMEEIEKDIMYLIRYLDQFPDSKSKSIMKEQLNKLI